MNFILSGHGGGGWSSGGGGLSKGNETKGKLKWKKYKLSKMTT